MKKTTFAVKVNSVTASRVKNFCRERGIKYGFFVEKALEDRLDFEELKEDLLDFKTLREQEKIAIPLEEYMRKRHV